MNLQSAADTGDLERVQLLLGQGVDIDEADSHGYTALLNAARERTFKLCNALWNKELT